MKRTLLKSKIHKARVTDLHLDYEGSTTIDSALMKEVDILPHEQIQIYNMSNGNRFETYAITAPAGSGEICVNGAAALLVEAGDHIIIASYGICDEQEARELKPKIVVLGENNKIVKKV
jgi:aspartate 1-decarboxylase